MRKKTHQEFIEELYNKNQNIEVIGQYLGTDIPIHCRCKIDGCEWNPTPHMLLGGRGCPYCSGNLVITGKNDLQTLRPDLMDEWDWEKNNQIGLNPSNLKINSAVRVWWKCKEYGHSYNTLLYSRTSIQLVRCRA